uniref:Uncharacterized protein n=1 Tax=uncultured prokaryote TaxID=198431 RepID=A0A0H5QK72_9ZZZZ|nr:hypothetical protein [uncultured prokaryote]
MTRSKKTSHSFLRSVGWAEQNDRFTVLFRLHAGSERGSSTPYGPIMVWQVPSNLATDPEFTAWCNMRYDMQERAQEREAAVENLKLEVPLPGL